MVERQVVIGVAAAGVLAGQAMQRWLARSQFVELFIRPTDGRDFVIVQPTRGTPLRWTECQDRLLAW
jgi:outer membrane lipoprotein SlyB